MHRDGAVQGREGDSSLRLPHGREEDSSRSLLPSSGVRTRTDLLRGSGFELLSTGDLMLSPGSVVLRRGSELLPLTVAV